MTPRLAMRRWIWPDAAARAIRLALLACGLLLALPLPAETSEEELEALGDKAIIGGLATSRIIIPVPLVTPQLGAGLGVGAAWFYTPSGSARPWVTGVGAIATTNGSWGLGGTHRMTLGGDRVRVDLTAATGRLNTQFFGVGGEAGQENDGVGITQTPMLFQGQVTTRIADNLFMGGRLRFLDMETRVRDGQVVPPGTELDDIEEDRRVVALGPVLALDLTDGSLNPRTGTKINGQWLFSLPGLGSDSSFSKANLTANHYVDVDERTVAAFRAALCAASEDTPFFELCLFGSSANLRGYPSGQFRDRASWAVQGEWRRHLGGRWGVVAFAGIGGVAPSLGALGSSTLLPAAGGGIRFEVSREYRVNLRLDGAVGRDSQAIYLSIGEAF